MKEITKLAVLLGSKSFTLVIFVVACLIVGTAFLWQQQINSSQLQRQEEQQNKQHQQTLMMLNKVTSSQIMLFQKQLVLLAQRPVLSDVLISKDAAQIDNQQQILHKVFPSAKNVCLIGVDVDNVDPNGCIAISYATLESLRQAKKDGTSSIALLQAGTESAHVLLAQRITDQNNNVVGVLALTFPPEMVANLLFKNEQVDGYAELLQGTKNQVLLAFKGDVNFKQGITPLQINIAGTHWHIAYWPQKTSVITPSFMPMIILFSALILLWLLLKAVRSYLHKTDIATLKQQLFDLNSGVMKTKYTLVDSGLRDVSATIQSLAKATSTAPSANNELTKKETTFERISKKLEENKTDNPHELDMLEDNVEIDPSIFKAYDIRGIVDQTLNSQVFNIIGRAIGSEAQALGLKHIVVGRDGRYSSPEYSESLIAGIISTGCDVTDLGMVPTPVTYFASHHLETQSAVMITGSHNPANYNGIKIILAGKSVAGDDLQTLYRRIDQGDLVKGQGVQHKADVGVDYIKRIVDDIHLSRPMKIVIDCGNGVAGNTAPQLFRALGCEVIELYCEVDGAFPNHNPDPSQPDNLQDLALAVKQYGAELGIAFDGDGDRLGVVDKTGNVIFPDRMMMMFAEDVLLRMPGSVIIYDVKSTNLLGEEISRAGGEAVMWQSGHSVIKNKMLEMGAQLAGELSGHIFFKERWYGFDDGLYAAARLLELICQDSLQRNATEIFAALPNRKNTPEILLAMDAAESKRFIAKLQQEGDFPDGQVTKMDGLRADYVNGWGLVRSSNTVPGLTMRFEGDTYADVFEIQQLFQQQMLAVDPSLNIPFVEITDKPVVEAEKSSPAENETVVLSMDESEDLIFDKPVSNVQTSPLSSTPEKKSGLTLKDID
jgi:phosphomannomutase / phosphoglucomutase